jgi:hypothetical protein
MLHSKIMTLEESGYRPKQLISEKPNLLKKGNL